MMVSRTPRTNADPSWTSVMALAVGVAMACACKGGAEHDSPPVTSAPLAGGALDAAAAKPVPKMMRLDPPAAPGAMAPSLLSTSHGVVASWLEPAKTASKKRPATIGLRVATLHGGTWGSPTTVAEGAGLVANWADVPVLGAAKGSVLVSSWAQSSGSDVYTYDVRLARSSDAGASWNQLGSPHISGKPAEYGFVSMVREGPATRAFWLDGRATVGVHHGGGAMSLRTALVGDAVGNDELVDRSVCDCCGTAAAQTSSGSVVVYRDRTTAEVRDIWIARRIKGAWVKAPVYRDGWKITGCPVNGPAVDARDQAVVVAWYTYADGVPRVRVAFSKDSGASFAPPHTIDAPAGQRAPLGRVAVALVKGEQQAVVGWMTTSRELAAIRIRRIASDGRMSPSVVVAKPRAGRSAGFPRMVRDGKDLVMAWTEPGKQSRLRAARVPLGLIPPVVRRRPPVKPAPARLGGISVLPPLAARTLDDRAVTLESLRGQPVLFNVWATWCEPCRRELPVLQALAEKYKGRGLQVVGVSVDQTKSLAELRRFVARRKLTYAMWHDKADAASAILGVGTLPATFLISRTGIVMWRSSGVVAPGDPGLARSLEAALGPKRP